MNDPMLLHRIAARLVAEPQLSQRLWLEVPEHGVFQHLEQFRILCALLKPAGCKIDASFVNDLEQNPSNQVFLRGLAIIAHSIGLSAIGEGARSEAEIASLLELGFDGVTGPAVTQGPEQTG